MGRCGIGDGAPGYSARRKVMLPLAGVSAEMKRQLAELGYAGRDDEDKDSEAGDGDE